MLGLGLGFQNQFGSVIGGSSSVYHYCFYWPYFFAQRYGKQSKEENEIISNFKGGGDRAPSTAQEFNRVAAERQFKESDKEVAHRNHHDGGEESQHLEKTTSNPNHPTDLDKGLPFRPCS